MTSDLSSAPVGRRSLFTTAGGAAFGAAYQFDEDVGVTALDSSGNGRDATIISPPVKVVTPQGLTGYWEAPDNWIGRPQNPADPHLAGVVDDIRIHQRALADAELARLVLFGPLNSLGDDLAGQPIRGGVRTSLTVKLDTVAALLRRGRPDETLAPLDDFVGETGDLRGGQPTDARVDALIDSAALIRSTIPRGTS
jgi:hypothetical protein